MKTISYWSAILVLLLVSSYAQAESARVEVDRAEYEQFKAWQTDQATLKKNVETVKGVLAAEGREDTDAFFAPFSADSTFWMIGSSPSAGTLQGIPAQKAAFNMFMEQLDSGISMTVTNAFAAGDWVVTEAVGKAQTVDGRPYNGNYCVLVKFEDDEIVEFREYLDTKLMSDTFVFEGAQ
ncbi:MAG: nuclear transport factor 2 family protein [Myxococcota bacterium]|nr:nuclear transport factor 2 family protein [Myxococcota bacterium]